MTKREMYEAIVEILNGNEVEAEVSELVEFCNKEIEGLDKKAAKAKENAEKRMEYMSHYFETVLEGYRSETEVSEELLNRLPLFIDMVLIENVVDEFECCAREGEELDYEDIEDAAECLIHKIPFAGVGEA